MSKRSYPFSDNCCRQTKIHVSNREVGKDDDKYMKEIYAKTREKLFQGANNNNNNNSLSSAEPVLELELCEKCNILGVIEGRCWFCEIGLCSNCTNMCSNCCELFCSRCCLSLTNGNTHVCLTCYS